MLIAAELAHVLLLAGAVVGCATILHAGLAQSRGELEAARAAARRGGFVMAGCTLATLASGAAVLSLLPTAARQQLLGPTLNVTAFLALSSFLTVLSGFIGLLAGLSGKPRPAGYFAAACYTGGVACLVAALLG